MSTELEAVVGGTEAAVIADLAQQAAEPAVLGEHLIAVPGGQGRVRVVDLEEYDDNPRRATAFRTVITARSLIDYVTRHGTKSTELYADPTAARIVAVIDSHDRGLPGWQSHLCTLQLTKSPAWLAWERLDGKWLNQVEFAEFIELQAQDVRDPAPAAILELAQHFEAKRSVDFESSDRMADGQVRLAYKETIQARAGQRGEIEIPTSIKLAIKPYIGGPTYAVVARFRYRLTDHRLALGYVLERPQLILESAFTDVVDTVIHGYASKPDSASDDDFAGLGTTHPLYTGTR